MAYVIEGDERRERKAKQHQSELTWFGLHALLSVLCSYPTAAWNRLSLSIRYIHIEYDDNVKSYWSQKHGYSSSLSLDKIESIKLDYPEEYLTSVHGYYKSTWYLPTYISSLTFTSNRKVYGPFGDYENEGRKYFTTQVSGSKIVGFHGRSDEWFDLRALGAYVTPLARPPPPYYGSYYTNPNHPPQAAPTPYPYGYYVPPPGLPPYNNGYYDYQMSQAPPPPPSAALGRPRKPKSAPGNPKAAKNNDPKNVSYRVLGNEVSGNTGDHNGVFNVGNKNTGLHKEDDEEDEE
ncbi:hypothetical protein ACLB2K_042171 [Fragaria x ananassa]